jgi:hypothetical protein
VSSLEPSEQTTTSSRSRGHSSASAFATLAAITAPSSCAATISETVGGSVATPGRGAAGASSAPGAAGRPAGAARASATSASG